LAGIYKNGGICGLIRQSTKNLTNILIYLFFNNNNKKKIIYTVLHGCRQSVL